MKNHLFPHIFQPIGWIMFVLSLLLGVLALYGKVLNAGILETIVIDSAIIGTALGSLFIVCSREKIEDEMTKSIRLASLLNSIYAYVGLLILCTIFINGIDFLLYAVINMLLLPVIFVINFKFELYRYSKLTDDEE